MIAVVADDLSGAAELAGIALRYGLSVQLGVPGIIYNGADVFVISTDSRSMQVEDAKKVTADVLKQLLPMKPSLLYKKIDSVLRGHVLQELLVEMEITGCKKALIVPANPSLGRIIRNGKYFVGGEEITNTAFLHDPEFPVRSADVRDMIRSGAATIQVSQPAQNIEGITIGEASNDIDIRSWASKADGETVLVGAGDFFTALLERNFSATVFSPVEMKTPHLFVSGTAFKTSRHFIQQVHRKSACVSYLPPDLLQGDKAKDERWFNNAIEILQKHHKCIIAIDESADVSPASWRKITALTVRNLLVRTHVAELFIEGGSTAMAILDELKIYSSTAEQEWQRGVVRMKANELFITVKPGSYELPVVMRDLYLKGSHKS